MNTHLLPGPLHPPPACSFPASVTLALSEPMPASSGSRSPHSCRPPERAGFLTRELSVSPNLMTTVFPTDLALSFPGVPKIKVGKNGKKGQCSLRETTADRYDKGLRSTPTPKMATGGGVAVSVPLPSHRPRSHGSPLSAGWRQLFPSADVLAQSRRAAPQPSPSPMTHWSSASSPIRPKQPAEPGVWLRADRVARRGLYSLICKMGQLVA